MKLTKQELLDKKEEIDHAKSELDSLKGQKKVYESQLKKDWKCTTLEDAKTKLRKMQIENAELDTEIDNDLELIQEKYFTQDD